MPSGPDRPRFAHGRSLVFLESDYRVNRSQSLFKMSDFERKSERVKEQISNPALSPTDDILKGYLAEMLAIYKFIKTN